MASSLPSTDIDLAGLAGGSLQVAATRHEAIAEAITPGEPDEAQPFMAEDG
ncbi:hypothetical protein AB0M68_38440 [Streptomyces sp. NPDC051453]|uniref:hypothetical protein n=1 Tax=Streptomyces sp. NPDC051453 TaxID=3154941 RepID=UPI003444A4BA